MTEFISTDKDLDIATLVKPINQSLISAAFLILGLQIHKVNKLLSTQGA